MNTRRTGRAVICLSLLVLMGALCLPLAAQGGSAVQTSPAASAVPDEGQLFWGNQPDGTAPGGVSESRPTMESFGIWDLLRMVLVLALVVGAAYGILVLVRKNKAGPLADNRLMKVLANQTLAGNRSLHLVAIQKEVFLVGSSDSSVNLIAKIENPDTCQELLLLAAEQATGPKANFTDLLGSVFSAGFTKNFGKKNTPSDTVSTGDEFAGQEQSDDTAFRDDQSSTRDSAARDADGRNQPDLGEQRERLRNL